MRAIPLWLLTVFAFFPAGLSGQDIPKLIRPGDVDEVRPAGFGRSFGSTKYRHGRGMLHEISPASHPPGAPFFSPDGRTVYVPGRGLAALDSETGDLRFDYRYGQYNMSVTDFDDAGITLQFYQGPLTGQSVRLEHGTGRELHRADIPELGGRKVARIFGDQDRYVLRGSIPTPRPQRNPPEPDQAEPSVILYDATNQKTLIELPCIGMSGDAVLTPDERTLLVMSNQELTAVDTENGRKLWSMPHGIPDNVRSFPVVSHDSQTAWVWRLHERRAQIVAIDIATGEVSDVLVSDNRRAVYSSPVISPDEKLLAYMVNDDPWDQCGYWRIISTTDHSEVCVVDVRPEITTASFSPDSRSFWLRSQWGLARFNLESGQFDSDSLASLTTPQCLKFSRDGTRLFEVSGAELRTWDTATGAEAEPSRMFDRPFKEVAHMRCRHLTDDGTRSIWAGRFNDKQIHSVVNGSIVRSFYAANMIEGGDYALTPDLQRIVHDDYYGELRVRDLWTGEVLHELLPMTRPRMSYRMTLAPDCRTLALVVRGSGQSRFSGDSNIQFWDIQRGIKKNAITQAGDFHKEMTFSADSRILWQSDTFTRVKWNVTDRVLLQRAERNDTWSNWKVPAMCRNWSIQCGFGAGHLALIETGTMQTARRWDTGNVRESQAVLSHDHRTLAVTTPYEPIVLFDFFEPRDDAIELRKLPVAELVNRLEQENPKAAFDCMCELIRRGDDSVTVLDEVFGAADVTSEAIPRRLSLLQQRGELFLSRAIEVLYAIHSHQSRAVLTRLASGDEQHPATIAAVTALREWDHGY